MEIFFYKDVKKQNIHGNFVCIFGKEEFIKLNKRKQAKAYKDLVNKEEAINDSKIEDCSNIIDSINKHIYDMQITNKQNIFYVETSTDFMDLINCIHEALKHKEPSVNVKKCANTSLELLESVLNECMEISASISKAIAIKYKTIYNLYKEISIKEISNIKYEERGKMYVIGENRALKIYNFCKNFNY